MEGVGVLNSACRLFILSVVFLEHQHQELMNSSKSEYLFDEWLRSEELSLEYAEKANRWLRGFYSEQEKTFHIQFTNEDQVNNTPGLHTATYHIGSIVMDYQPSFLSASEQKVWQSSKNLLQELLDQLNAGLITNVLPLRNLGLLPIFSSSYRAEFMAYMEAPLKSIEYAIVIRRILYALFNQQMAQWNYALKFDKLHPFLLFRCTKALLKLEELLRKAHTDDIKSFVGNLKNEENFRQATAGLNYDESEFERVYGVGTKSANFESEVLSKIARDDGGPGDSLINTLKWIEDLSVNSAVAEIARSRQDNQRSDPSALVFSLVSLTVLDASRHDALLAQGMRLVADACQQGTFQAAMPFHIDEKGRALFASSIEIANALVKITLDRISRMSDSEIDFILKTMSQIQTRLAEDYNLVDVHPEPTETEKRYGWCSDKAPSPYRIDSWATAQTLLFFLRHIEILRWAKRRHILKEYSWRPYAKIKVKWDDIVDPDDPEGLKGPKSTIEKVIENKEKLSKAPMFLLYGPPGTSKTTLVEGIAQKMGWDLVTLSPSDFVVESLDRIEFRSKKIFQDLMNLDNCIILMDELDALLKDRDTLMQFSPGSIMEFVAPALLPKIQELRQHALERNIAVFFVTNFYERIDPALSRSGRIDNHLIILPYSKESQYAVAKALIEQSKADHDAVAKVTEVLADLPCTLGYRDVEQIVIAVVSGEPLDNVKTFAKSLGVSPKSYSAKGRLKGYQEFVAFAMRHENEVIDNRVISSMAEDEASNILKRIGVSVRTKKPEFSRALEKWAYTLDEQSKAQ